MKIKKKGIQKGVYILPNLLTTGNLFCGFFSIIRAIHGDYITASWAILWAGVFDFLDGRVARFTRGQSEFGLEYDSLCDLCSFGLAPAILMYTWVLSPFKQFGWTAAFVFFACGALRLARFNVQVSDVEKKGFQGLPIPGAAYTMASFVILHHYLYGKRIPSGIGILIMTFTLAFLMISQVPYRSFKVLDLNRRANFFLLVFFVGVVFVIASVPQVMIFVVTIAYVSVGVLEEIFRSPMRIGHLIGALRRQMQPEEKREKSTFKVIEMRKDQDEQFKM